MAIFLLLPPKCQDYRHVLPFEAILDLSTSFSCSPFLSQKRQKLEPSRVGLERQLEEKAEECNRLQELLERKKGEAQQSAKE